MNYFSSHVKSCSSQRIDSSKIGKRSYKTTMILELEVAGFAENDNYLLIRYYFFAIEQNALFNEIFISENALI